jgi:hypothetical protein
LSYTAKILCVGGGGGGGNDIYGGGGGGGQVSYNASASLTLTSYTVTVDPGGGVVTNGGTTSFGAVLTASGGAHGITTGGAGGASGSGYSGANGGTNSGGGGGGDSANGSAGSTNTGGNGGNGTSNSISGSAVIYGGGGGGGGGNTGGTGGTGGGGGGGFTGQGGGAGTTNTGGGGGGGGNNGSAVGAAGGSGIVIVSWVTANFPTMSITGTGNTITTSGSNSIATFIVSGILAFPTTNAYWVGGTANWDGSTTTNWAYTSGGSGGAFVPLSTTSVYFDGNSGGGTVTITATANCTNLTTTGFTGHITGSNALNVYGNLILITSLFSSYTGTLTFASTSASQTITGASNNLGTVVFNGSGGGWTLQDNWSAISVILTAGTLAASSRTITLTGTGTVWTGGATFTAGTSTIVISDTSSSSKTFAGAGLTYNNLTFSGGTGVHIITGSNTFNAIAITTPPTTINFTAGTTQTMTSSAFTVSGTAGNLNVLQSTSAGSAWYLAQSFTGNVVCDYISLQDSHVI